MLRRDFIKLTAALGAASALPLWSRAARRPIGRPCRYRRC